MRANVKKTNLAFALLACGLGGCTSGQVGSYPLNSQPPSSAAKLQFAVGVATYVQQADNGAPAQLRHDLNLVETLRNANGTSGAQTDVPAVTGPSTYVAGLQPSYDGALSNQIFKFFKNYPALGYGFGALIGSNGGPLQNTPEQFIGGPPAWPSIANSQYPSTFVGFGLGFVVFPPLNQQPSNANTVVTGTYSLTTAFTTNPQQLGNFPVTAAPPGSLTANGTISNVTGLPLPTSPNFVPDGVGGGSFQVYVPAGVTETVVLLQVANQCYTALSTPFTGPGATVFSLVSTTPGPGTQTLVLPSNLGPTGNQHTLCTSADNAAVGVTGGTNVGGYVIQADYPLYESSYPLSTTQKPTITGSSGQADVAYLTFSSGNYP
jgi:hypothetical protein